MTTVLDLGDVPADDPRPRVRRLAVRAVISPRPGVLLMLRTAAGDWKFPGGGVEPGEDAQSALRREVREECGIDRLVVGDGLLTVVERRPAQEPGLVFEMTSRYFACATDQQPGAVTAGLSAEEQALGLVPAIVTVGEALRPVADGPPWVAREQAVLRLLAERRSAGSPTAPAPTMDGP